MSKKTGMDKETRKNLRDEIQSLLESISTQQDDNLVADKEFSNEVKIESPYDFEKMSIEFTNKAREITDSMYKNFVDIGIFNKNDYHKYKKELDTINISNLFFQLKTLKIAIIKLMEHISSGNADYKLIEAMGNLQDRLASITKTQANYILFLEETYKKLNNDPQINQTQDQISSNPNEGEFFVTVGTKNLIKNLPTSNNPGSHYIRKNDTSGKFTDPSLKLDLMKEKNIEIESEDLTGDNIIDIEEII